jgi:hypothetical protein
MVPARRIPAAGRLPPAGAAEKPDEEVQFTDRRIVDDRHILCSRSSSVAFLTRPIYIDITAFICLLCMSLAAEKYAYTRQNINEQRGTTWAEYLRRIVCRTLLHPFLSGKALSPHSDRDTFPYLRGALQQLDLFPWTLRHHHCPPVTSLTTEKGNVRASVDYIK